MSGMKYIAYLLVYAAGLPVFAETYIGASISIHQPGIYGRIDTGNFPAPSVIYADPIVVVATPISTYQRPIYLYVPPGHLRDWSNHCGAYSACGQPVYFVQEKWVREQHERSQVQQFQGPKSKGREHQNQRGGQGQK